MPSLLPGYEYDIFISYRHNDNRSGWVTEFVKTLQEELAATIKEPVSVYFDTNPHDGLLDTHNVDKSLKNKLKCLIFIPIVSQTYCDPKCFAWQQEFCVFNKLSKEDAFGRDIRLSNGNVAGRILPIKIHDLDVEDKIIIENELGEVLRAIEFVFNSTGVSRPLTVTDKREENTNKTFYRDQINKTARAIKDLIVSIRHSKDSVTEKKDQNPPHLRYDRKKFNRVATVITILALLGFSYYFFGGFGERTTLVDQSIAILPFVDMSPNHDQEYFGDGLAEEIINALASANELRVIGRASSFQFKGKNEDLRTIGKLLGVVHILEGTVKKSGDKLRVTAVLSSTIDGAQLWSETFNRDHQDYLEVQDEIAKHIARYLKVSISGNAKSTLRLSAIGEANKFYQQGRYFHDRNGSGDMRIAREYLSRAVKIDSGFALAWAFLGIAAGNTDSTLANCWRFSFRALKLSPDLADGHINLALLYYTDLNFTQVEVELRTALSLDKGNPRTLRNSGRYLALIGRYKEGLELCLKAVQLDPLQTWSYFSLTQAYLMNGQFKNALEAWSQENEISKRDGSLTRANLLILNGNANEALKLINKIHEERYRLFLLTLISHSLHQVSKSDEYFQLYKTKYGELWPLSIIEINVFRGEMDDALNNLDKLSLAKATFWDTPEYWLNRYMYLMGSPYLIPIRDEPKFKECARKMGYPE